MHSLYWRIFLAFWVALALILVGTLTVAVNATAHRTDRPWAVSYTHLDVYKRQVVNHPALTR